MDNKNNNTINNNINIINTPLNIDKSYTPSTIDKSYTPSAKDKLNKPLVSNEIGEIDNTDMDNESVNALENNSPTENMDDDNNEDYQYPGDVEYERFEQYMEDLNEGENTDMSDSAYEHRYNNFENYIESSDYTANYGENEDGDYDNY